MEVVNRLADGKRRAKRAVATLVQALPELGLAERALEIREEVCDGLRVVPDMCTRAVAAALSIAAALPGPEPSVVLSENRRAAQDREVGDDRLHHLGRQRRVVKSIAKGEGPRAQVGQARLEIL